MLGNLRGSPPSVRLSQLRSSARPGAALTEQEQLHLPGRLLAVLPQVPVDHLAPLHRRLVLGAQRAAHLGRGRVPRRGEKRGAEGSGETLRSGGKQSLPAFFLPPSPPEVQAARTTFTSRASKGRAERKKKHQKTTPKS